MPLTNRNLTIEFLRVDLAFVHDRNLSISFDLDIRATEAPLELVQESPSPNESDLEQGVRQAANRRRYLDYTRDLERNSLLNDHAYGIRVIYRSPLVEGNALIILGTYNNFLDIRQNSTKTISTRLGILREAVQFRSAPNITQELFDRVISTPGTFFFEADEALEVEQQPDEIRRTFFSSIEYQPRFDCPVLGDQEPEEPEEGDVDLPGLGEDDEPVNPCEIAEESEDESGIRVGNILGDGLEGLRDARDNLLDDFRRSNDDRARIPGLLNQELPDEDEIQNIGIDGINFGEIDISSDDFERVGRRIRRVSRTRQLINPEVFDESNRTIARIPKINFSAIRCEEPGVVPRRANGNRIPSAYVATLPSTVENTTVKDTFRYTIGAYFNKKIDSNNVNYFVENEGDAIFPRRINDNNVTFENIGVPFEGVVVAPLDENGARVDRFRRDAVREGEDHFVEKVVIYFKKGNNFPFIPYVLGNSAAPYNKPLVPFGEVFSDTYFEAPIAFSEDELENFAEGSYLTVGVDSAYNFYDANYEQIQLSLPETDLPNMYTYIGYGQYLADLRNGVIEQSAGEDILFGSQDYTDIDNSFSLRTQFPMYVSLSMDTDLSEGEDPLSTLIARSRYDKLVTQRVKNTEPVKKDFKEIFQQTLVGLDDTTRTIRRLENSERSTWNLGQLIAQIRRDDVNEDDFPFPDQTNNEFFRDTLLRAFNIKYEEIAKDKLRTFAEVLGGKPAHSEAMIYKVSKFLVEDGVIGEEPVQNLYFFDSDDIGQINYIDTQIGYNREYIYVFTVFMLVLGTNYKYLRRENSCGGMSQGYMFDVVYAPNFQLVEVPYFEAVPTKVLDKPPAAPDALITPFKGVDKKVVIWLNNDNGEYYLEPIVIEERDEEEFNSIRKSQGVRIRQDRVTGESRGKVTFKGDDFSRIFEVFRLDTEPNKWTDFAGTKRVFTSYASSFDLIDDIRPNKKYWYTFRVRDIHGHISNPTTIFQVELIDDQDMTFLDQKVFEFREPVREPVKMFKKYLHVQPAYEHTLAETEEGQDIADIKLGSGEKTPWDRRYKLRVTSKATGKKIDINVKFIQRNKIAQRRESSGQQTVARSGESNFSLNGSSDILRGTVARSDESNFSLNGDQDSFLARSERSLNPGISGGRSSSLSRSERSLNPGINNRDDNDN